ncbi:LysR family transcriptional regulator [Magnetofaba australis]|uniref:Putative LysR family transcriptional regulator n=1 Tax=Magnetofaba australis IT-1 TaxID=1434232 RepID=A0A1Y2K0L1_9PROT|nr:LysR family transcriptional regulator [Magnetofaba australis]OSM01558.1 putative LysR family transcriptional regulator [Magnetofaba australis IT-1]
MKRNLNKFDLNLLVAFDTLMMERGVTRAGRALGITQAAMSNTLRRLREIFDDPLFVKSGARMEPTPRALELAEPVALALQKIRVALDQERFDPYGSKRTFRIGMLDYFTAMLMPELTQLLSRVAPGVVVRAVDVGGEDEISALERGDVDIIFSRFQWVPPKVTLNRLLEMEYVCLHRKNHPLVGDGKLTMEALLEARHIQYYPRGMDNTVVDEALAERDLHRQIVCRLGSFGMLPALVAGSDLMTCMPEGAARVMARQANLQVSQLPFPTAKLRLAIAWHPRTERDPAHIWFREQVKTTIERSEWRRQPE